MAVGMPAAVCVLDPTQDRSVPSSAAGGGVVRPHCPVGCGVDPRGTAALQGAGCLCILSSPSLRVSPAPPLEPGVCPLFSAVLIPIPHRSLPCEALTAFNLGRRRVILCPAARPGRPGMRETSAPAGGSAPVGHTEKLRLGEGCVSSYRENLMNTVSVGGTKGRKDPPGGGQTSARVPRRPAEREPPGAKGRAGGGGGDPRREGRAGRGL